jgi:hypothetical protein
MSEKLSAEEFFERARKGEFLGAEVTVIQKPIVLTVKESQEDDWLEGDWYVGDDDFALYEGYTDDVDHLIVKEKPNG